MHNSTIDPGNTLIIYLPESATTNQPKGKKTFYTVKAGDCLGTIAEKFGVTVAEIEKWNQMHNSTIDPGNTLIIYLPENKK